MAVQASRRRERPDFRRREGHRRVGQERALARQGGVKFSRHAEPLVLGTGRERAERTDHALAGTGGSGDRFDEEMIDVGGVLDAPSSAPDIHPHLSSHYSLA